MARRFTLVTKDYQDYDTDLIGVSKDAGLSEGQPTHNLGSCVTIFLGENSGVENHAAIELVMPTEEDLIGLDALEKVELMIYVTISSAGTKVLGLIEITDIWDEGELCNAVGFCSWDDAQDSVPWTKGGGAIDSTTGSKDDSETIIDTHRNAGAVNYWMTFDVTPVISMGDKKTVIMYFVENITGGLQSLIYASRENATVAHRPILRVTYRDYPPDGFTDDDDKLRIEPNPDDQTQPKLIWGGVDAPDFTQYKIYRDTSPITAIDGFKSAITAVVIWTDTITIAGDHTDALPIGSTFKITGSTGNDGRWTVDTVTYTGGNTEIVTVEDVTDATVDGDVHHGIKTSTDSAFEEFIDTFAHVDGTTYYYRLIAEDQDNHEDNALRSATVSFTKPDITTITISPNGAQTVGTLVTVTTTSPQNIKKLFTNWGDDLGGSDDVETWREYETVATSQQDIHIYSMQTGGVDVPLKCRIEDENGFWSSLTNITGTSAKFDDVNPTAKLRVDVKKATLGDEVTLDGTLSQPVASNVTITSYKFWRYAGDTSPVTQSDPVFTFITTPGSPEFTPGIKTATLEITTSSVKQDTDTTTYELETGTPTELQFSSDTKIHELTHDLRQSKLVELPVGSDGVEHEFLIARRAERISLVGTSNHPNVGDDIAIIRNAWLSNTFVRFTVSTEMEDHVVQYDCKIDGGISLGQAYDNKQSWSFPIRVITRTEL